MQPTVERSPSPRGLPRAAVLLIAVAAIVVIVAGMRAAAWLLAPILLAMVIVIAAHPVPEWMKRHGVPSWLATASLVIAVYAVIVVLFVVIVVSVASLVSLLPQYADRADDLVNNIQSALASYGVTGSDSAQATSGLNLESLAGYLGTLLGAATTVASGVVFLLALLLFLSVEAIGVGARHDQIASDRPSIMTAVRGFIHNTRRYLVVTTVFGLAVAILDTIALWIMDIPLPLLWGLLAFVTGFIPSIGFVLGVIPPALLALLDGGWELMLAVIVVYLVLNAGLQSGIQPRFVGDAVGLSTTISFLSLIVWSWILGPIGAIIAVPMTLLVKALLVDSDPTARWVEALIGSAPKPTPAASAGAEPEEPKPVPRQRGRTARPAATPRPAAGAQPRSADPGPAGS